MSDPNPRHPLVPDIAKVRVTIIYIYMHVLCVYVQQVCSLFKHVVIMYNNKMLYRYKCLNNRSITIIFLYFIINYNRN